MYSEFGKRHSINTVVLVVLTAAIAMGQTAQAPRPPMAEEVFKNVQILKGIPVDEFMDTMGMFAAATSLNCTSCHASDNTNTWDKYAVDTPLKQTARRMMNMVNAINKENFKGVPTVTCYTCHHGDERPKPVPSLLVQYTAPLEDPDEIEIPPNAKGASPDDVFAKYIQALGGAQRLANLTSFAAKGTYSGYETISRRSRLKFTRKFRRNARLSYMLSSATASACSTVVPAGSHRRTARCR